jgi:Tfp pilus assembly protein PilF
MDTWPVVIAILVCAILPSPALGISGQSMAIGRAFSYAYNNPQQQVGTGPLGSSVYSGSPTYRPVSSVAPVPQMSSPLSNSMQSVSVYTPMSPVLIAPSGGGAIVTSGGGSPTYSNPVRDMASALAEKDRQGPSITAEPLTSLAPQTPGAYRSAMLRGESQFRNGNYAEAANSFETARQLSNDAPESLLALAHVYFAKADASPDQAADYLAKALRQFPDLPLVRVRPKDFFGNTDNYAKAFARVESFVKDNPKDAAALLLLGYLQWRTGLVDEALNSLDAAMACSVQSSTAPSIKDLTDAITVMLDGISRSGQIVLSKAPPIDPVQDYPWAGIRLGLPSGTKTDPLTSLSQVIVGMTAGDGDSKNEPLQVALYAYPVGEGVTVRAFLDSMTDFLRQSPTVKDMATSAEAEVPFTTGKAWVRIFMYKQPANDSKVAMGWVAFIREPQDKQGARIGYLLGLATGDQQADKVLPALAAICKTIALINPVSFNPAADVQGSTFQDSQRAFSIVQPAGWAGRQTDKGFEMSQMDFARGNVVSPRAEVIVQTIPGSYSPQSFGQEAAQRKVPEGMTRTILSQGPATLGGQEGHQFVVSQSPQEGSTGAASVLVGRLICIDKPDGNKTMYALVVDCRDTQAKDAQTLADKLASSFKILPPEQGASSGR